MEKRSEASLKQEKYYTETAEIYDRRGVEEISYALFLLDGYIKRSKCKSVLDIGSGTGRALHEIAASFPEIKFIGIEPNEAMRSVGHKRGIPKEKLVYGDASKLEFKTDSFDVVTEFGVLHHAANPRAAVQEMVRVARRGVFLCDSNNWGQGSALARAVKFVLRKCRLWKLFIALSTRGKIYKFSEGDGVFYSFSLYEMLDIVSGKFPKIYIMNGDSPRIVYNGILQAPGICVLATKD